MKHLSRALIALSLFFSFILTAQAETTTSILEGEVIADSINIRSDATVSSNVICVVNRGEHLEAVSRSYDWYKVRLPKSAPSFIKKEYLSMIDDKTAKVAASSVNIRLAPSESSAVLGKAKDNEVVSIIETKGEWARVEPVNNSFGWIHSRYLKAAPPKEKTPADTTDNLKKDEIAVQGLIKNKSIVRVATHKLITEDGSIFLLKGNRKSLNSLDNKKAKVWGRLKQLPDQQYPLIEITRIEAEN